MDNHIAVVDKRRAGKDMCYRIQPSFEVATDRHIQNIFLKFYNQDIKNIRIV